MGGPKAVCWFWKQETFVEALVEEFVYVKMVQLGICYSVDTVELGFGFAESDVQYKERVGVVEFGISKEP